MFEQQNYYQPFGANTMMGAQQPTNFRIPSVLSPEEIDLLKNKATFSLTLSKEEMLRAVCNHRSADGLTDTLVYDPVTGLAKCQICGYEFRPIEPNMDYDTIKEDIKRVEDILQTTKLMYVDLPADAAKDYYPVIGLLEKLPQLVEYAAKNMAKHESYMYGYNDRNMGAAAMFQNLSNMFSNMSMQQNYAQQPQQPNYGYYNQPAGFPQAAYPNPFGYNGQAPVYNPGTPANFSYVPQGQPAPAAPAPAAPVAPADATVNQTVTV